MEAITKEGKYLLQKLDCNCNDCGFMSRDFVAYKKWEDWNLKLQQEAFAKDPNRKPNDKFQFDKSSVLSYGICEKFKDIFKSTEISFIPNTFQLNTQTCFVHRLDLLSEEDRNKKLGLV